MAKKTILILEGPLSDGLVDLLVKTGRPVQRVTAVGDLLQEAAAADLLVLDTEHPDLTLALYHQLQARLNIPLVFIAPPAAPDLSVTILRAPFDEADLLGQIEDLLVQAPDCVVKVGNLAIDLEGRRVTVGRRRIALSPLEFNLLAYLARHVGEAVSYGVLLTKVWGYEPGAGDPKVVTVCVRRLREKLGDSAARPQYLVTVRGIGYRLRSQQQWAEALRQA